MEEIIVEDKITSITSANIKYLITIYKLDPQCKGIRCVDLSNELKITKPSVHNMADNLCRMNLIKKEHYGTIVFTEEGKRLALKYNAYYDYILCHLEKIVPCKINCTSVICSLLSEIDTEYIDSIYQKITQS